MFCLISPSLERVAAEGFAGGYVLIVDPAIKRQIIAEVGTVDLLTGCRMNRGKLQLINSAIAINITKQQAERYRRRAQSVAWVFVHPIKAGRSPIARRSSARLT